MGWVGSGWVEIFQFFVGWVHYSRSTKNWKKNCVNAFKARLDKIRLHQTLILDFTADPTATGNRSLLLILGWVGVGPNCSTRSVLGLVGSVS